jgi:hypothetical protein
MTPDANEYEPDQFVTLRLYSTPHTGLALPGILFAGRQRSRSRIIINWPLVPQKVSQKKRILGRNREVLGNDLAFVVICMIINAHDWLLISGIIAKIIRDDWNPWHGCSPLPALFRCNLKLLWENSVVTVSSQAVSN